MTALPATLRAASAALLLAGPAVAGLGDFAFPVRSALAAEAAPAAQGRFVAGLGDVPAMPGLAPAGEEPMVFDKPGGRIAEAVMTGRVGRRDVVSFYDQTLPQLGWKRTAERTFVREGEELRLEFVGSGTTQPTKVRFVLNPR